MPASLVCIGGGVIAVELACMFNAFGTEVTIVEMLPAIIANEDDEAIKGLTQSLKKRGVEITRARSGIHCGRRGQEARDRYHRQRRANV